MSALLAVKRGKWALDVTWNFSIDIRQPTGDPQECRKVARILFSHVKRPTQGTPNIHIRWDVLKSTQQLLAMDKLCTQCWNYLGTSGIWTPHGSSFRNTRKVSSPSITSNAVLSNPIYHL